MLHNRIPFYPDITKDDIQITLNALEEFKEVEATGKKEILKKQGEYFNHQIYTARLFYLVDRLFVIHDPGTGKSCTETLAALSMLQTTGLYNKVTISTPASLVESMQEQMICKCTDGIFLERGIVRENKVDRVKEKPNSLFKNNFPILSHHDLWKRTMKSIDPLIGKTVEELREEFKNEVLMIDEISDLILNIFSSKKQGEDQYRISPEIYALKDITDLDDESIINSELKYIQFWRLLHAVPNLKFMGLTGTPIPNHPGEFFMLANLFLPLDNQYDIYEMSNKIFDLDVEDFSRLNGLISYIGSSPSVADVNFVGKVLDHKHVKGNKEIDSSLVLYFKELYSVQAEALYSVKDSSSAKNTHHSIQCYTDLNGRYGEKAILNKDDEEEEEYVVNKKAIKEQKTMLNDLTTQMRTSSIFAEIAYTEKMLYDKRDKVKGVGCSYVYNRLSDIIFDEFKAIFEHYGFQVITKEDLMKKSSIEITSDDGKFCTTSSVEIDILRQSSKRPRVVFLDRKVSPKIREKVLKIMSSEKNVRGEIIQILVASRIFEKGVNIGNIERMYRVCSEWSKTTEKQSRDRVLRETSAKHIINFFKKLGIDIKPKVDFTYFCPYSKYFYVNKEKTNIPKKFLKETISVDGTSYKRLDSECICYMIGFCNSDILEKVKINGKSLIGLPTFAICLETESLFDKLSEYIELETDISLFNSNDDYELLYYQNGIISSSGSGIPKNKVLIKHKSNNTKILLNPSLTETIYYRGFSLFYSDNGKLIKENSLCEVVSPSYYQYMTMEEKSFLAAKVLRPAKQIAADCKSNLKRNILPSSKDYTADCDYQKCEFVCSSDIINNESENKYVYEKGIFWDNKEVMYSEDKVNQLKNIILSMLKESYEIKFEEIYERFRQEQYGGYRDIQIEKALIEVIKTRTPFLNKYGFFCFISYNDEKLYLIRDQNILNSNLKQDLNNLVVVETEQDFTINSNEDDEEIIKEIEELDLEDDSSFIFQVKTLISKINIYSYKFKLLEDCYKRWIIDSIKNKNRRLPVDDYVVKFFGVYCSKIVVTLDDKEVIYNIHTLPKKNEIKSKQNSNVKKKDFKEFRVFDRKKLEWRDPTQEEIELLAPKIIKSSEEYLFPTFYVKTKKGDQKTTFYISYTNESGYKFVVCDGTTRRTPGVQFKSAKPQKVYSYVKGLYEMIDKSKYPGIRDVYKEISEAYDKIEQGSKSKTNFFDLLKVFCNKLEIVNMIDYEIKTSN